MPADWKVVSDFDVPVKQVLQIADKLGVKVSSLRNTLYDVKGQSVQLNVIITPDRTNADKLMTKLRTALSTATGTGRRFYAHNSLYFSRRPGIVSTVVDCEAR